VAGEAVAPAGDGVGVTVEFRGDHEVGRLVGLGTAQDEASPEGQALGSEAGVGDLRKALVFVGSEGDTSCFARHGRTSVVEEKRNRNDSGKGSPRAFDHQGVMCTRTFTLNLRICETLA
jgi:hypothetical protein